MYPKMKTIARYIFLPLLLLGTVAFAQERSLVDSISLGNMYQLKANGSLVGEGDLFDKSPEVDVAKALYGQFSGLLVKQGTGMSFENQAKLRLHGHSPLVLVDGIPRSIANITAEEIESITVLKDAASAALYGVKGANGVVMITTKRGKDSPLKVTAEYQYGLATIFRAPEFSDAYTYAYKVNEARALDGLAPMYNQDELYSFYTGSHPYSYPNVNWWDQIYRDHGDNHRAQFTFTGGNRNFRYFVAVDYLKDDALYKKPTADNRYNAKAYDNRLGIRANVDVNITDHTSMKIGVMARLEESNKPYSMRSTTNQIEKILYTLPAAAFPIKQADGAYGGSALKGAVNPVALLEESGNHQYSQTKVLADMTLRQDLGMVIPGLYADATIAFDYLGKMTEVAYKDWQYSEMVNNYASNGNTTYLVAEQKYYGTNSQNVTYSNWFSSLQMRFEIQGRLNWEHNFGKHHAEAHVAYRQRSWIENEQNASSKTQEILGSVSYNWNNRIFADAVVNYSGSAYLERGKRFNWYPAVSLAGVILEEPYIKAYASAGMSGMDDDLTHELWRQTYGSSNGKSFYFIDGSGSSGKAEGNMPSLILTPELSRKITFGLDNKFFGKRLGVNAEGFLENRRNILIDPSNVSGVIGISVSDQSMGEENYGGLDLGLNWEEKRGCFNYGVYANGGWLWSKVIDDGQEYQAYDYLYHKGNPVGQRYGLEVIGIFQDQVEINNSPTQTFGEVRPGDLKYRDQNGDGVIDSQDVVKMFGSSTPLFQFGFGFNVGWKGWNLYADFQGVTGVTISLLDSPLYQPLVNNGTISNTFLRREVTWTPETATTATMPRLTTVTNKNNYQKNSLWYRDGSFIKLRNVGVSYTFPKAWLRLCEATLFLKATNLFSLDNIQFADPEQLGAYYPSTRTFWAGVKMAFGKGVGEERNKCCKQRVKSQPYVPEVKEVVVEKEVIKEVPVEIVKEIIKKEGTLKGKYEDDIFFVIGKADLRPGEAFKLGRIAQILKDNPNAKIQITGYADSGTGTASINQKLSAQRAANVAQMLREAGVEASRIVSDSTGSDRDVAASPESNRVAVCIVNQ